MPNGSDCCNNQTLRIGVATTHFDWMGLKCCILHVVMRAKLFFNNFVIRRDNMSHVTCLRHVTTCRDVSLARGRLATVAFVFRFAFTFTVRIRDS